MRAKIAQDVFFMPPADYVLRDDMMHAFAPFLSENDGGMSRESSTTSKQWRIQARR